MADLFKVRVMVDNRAWYAHLKASSSGQLLQEFTKSVDGVLDEV